MTAARTPPTPVNLGDENEVSLNRVRRRVAAVGFVTIVLHGVFGLIGAAYVIDGQDRHGSAMGLLVMSTVIAVLGYVGVRVILQKSLWSPAWAVAALAPSVAAFVWLG